MGETLYGCVRCGYQLLMLEETEQHLVAPPPAVSSCEIVGALLYKRVCKNRADCARRMKDVVGGHEALRRASRNLVL